MRRFSPSMPPPRTLSGPASPASLESAPSLEDKVIGAPVNPAPRSLVRLLWVGIGLTAALLVLAFLLAAFKSRAALGKPLPDYGLVAGFTLTNQDGIGVGLNDLRGKVWVADIIFTRCPGPCLKMTRQMKDLQAALPQRSQAKLVTLTTDPD